MDLFSRSVLSWKLCNNLDTEFCLKALKDGRKPDVYLRAYSDGGEGKLPMRSTLRPNPVPPVRG